MLNPNLVVKNCLNNPLLQAALLLVARFLLAYLFISAGWNKLFSAEQTINYMASQGVPSFAYPLVVLLELGGGLAILFGFQARALALLLAVFNIVAGFMFHGSPDQATALMKNLGLGGGFLVLALHGAGAWSIDHLLERKTR